MALSVFQSPPFGASHCNPTIPIPYARADKAFSPLHSRQATAISACKCCPSPGASLSVPSIRGKPLQSNQWHSVLQESLPFSPLHSGQATAIGRPDSLDLQEQIFQSPPFGASHCNLAFLMHETPESVLSVPSIRGKPLQ